MTDPISGRPIPPEVQDTYRREFAQGRELFEKSLDAYESTSPDEAEKREKFKEVMGKAVTIMKESARGFMSESQQKQEAYLEKDYNDFLAKETPASQKQLHEDIDYIKRHLG